MQYVCISKLLEEALQVLSLQAPGVFFVQPPLRTCPQISTLNKKNSMDIFLDWQHYVFWVSRNCTSTKNIDEARGKLGLYIADYYISLCLSVSVSRSCSIWYANNPYIATRAAKLNCYFLPPHPLLKDFIFCSRTKCTPIVFMCIQWRVRGGTYLLNDNLLFFFWWVFCSRSVHNMVAEEIAEIFRLE